MRVITKVKEFISAKSGFDLLIIVYCAGLTAIFIYGFFSILYALIFDQSMLQHVDFGYADGIGL